MDQPSITEITKVIRLTWRNAHWLLLLAFGVAGAIFASMTQNPSFEARSSLLINKAANSPIQALYARLSSDGDIGGGGLSSLRSDPFQGKVVALLEADDFMTMTAARALEDPEFASMQTQVLAADVSPLTHLMNVFADEEIVVDKRLKIARHFRGITNIKVSGEGVMIKVVANRQDLAVYLANLVAKMAVEVVVARESREVEEARRYLADAITATRARLEAINDEVKDIKSKSPVSAETMQLGFEKRIAEMRQQEGLLTIQKAENDALIERLSGRRNDKITAKESASTAPLSKQLEALQSRRTLLVLQGFKQDSLEMQRLDTEINSLTTRVGPTPPPVAGGDSTDLDAFGYDFDIHAALTQLERQNIETDLRRTAVLAEIKKLRASQSALSLSPDQVLYDRAKRIEIEYRFLADALKQMTQIDIQKIAVENRLSVLQLASPDSILSNRGLSATMMAGFVLSLIFGIGAISILESFNPMVMGFKSIAELKIRYLGELPRVSTNRSLFRRTPPEFSAALLDTPLMTQVAARFLRIAKESGKGQCISIHSAMPSEGKSMVSMHLAAKLSSSGHRVLLIDADIERRSLTGVFQLRDLPGFSDLVRREAKDIDALLHRVRDDLTFLPGGLQAIDLTRQSELKDMQALLSQLRGRFDLIIIDTAPLNIVATSGVIASCVDTSILVVASLQTRLADARKAMDQLKFFTKNDIYTIINKTAVSRNRYYYQGNSSSEDGPKARRAVNEVRDIA